MTRLNLMWYNSIRLVSRKHVVYFALTTLNNCRSGLVKRLPFVQINESIYVCCIIYMYEDDTLKWLKRLKDGQWYTTRLLLFLISLKHYAQEKQTDKERYKFNYLFYFYGSHYAGSRRTATQPLSHTQHISHRDARAHITSTQPTAVTGATQIQVLFPHYPTFSTRPPVDDTENLIVRAVCQAGNWCRNSWKKSEHGEYGESPAAVTATNKAWTNQLRIKIKIGSLIPRSGFRFLIIVLGHFTRIGRTTWVLVRAAGECSRLTPAAPATCANKFANFVLWIKCVIRAQTVGAAQVGWARGLPVPLQPWRWFTLRYNCNYTGFFFYLLDTCFRSYTNTYIYISGGAPARLVVIAIVVARNRDLSLAHSKDFS